MWRLRRPVVSDGCDAGGMIPWNLLDLDKALRASWAADTCSPDDQADWQPGNPAWGHCDITALIVNDVFGGDLMVGEVHRDGTQRSFHWWNRLPSGVELDLTREQFQHGGTCMQLVELLSGLQPEHLMNSPPLSSQALTLRIPPAYRRDHPSSPPELNPKGQ
ncbi:hypothetical protein ACFYO0_40960 [Streptomyces sp. NPDC006365]|uniref:YunG family protein n=1 Tax=Streptomyces sp. NPDC006365 TaxID=3364744 RepID=UPI0036B26C01